MPTFLSVTTTPTFSPDGQWMWSGDAWIPAPPTAPPVPGLMVPSGAPAMVPVHGRAKLAGVRLPSADEWNSPFMIAAVAIVGFLVIVLVYSYNESKADYCSQGKRVVYDPACD